MTLTTTSGDALDTAPEDGVERQSVITKALMRQETTLIIVMVIIGAFAASRSPLFLSSANLTEILRSTVIYFVMACGAGLLIIGGGLDLSARRCLHARIARDGQDARRGPALARGGAARSWCCAASSGS